MPRGKLRTLLAVNLDDAAPLTFGKAHKTSSRRSSGGAYTSITPTMTEMTGNEVEEPRKVKSNKQSHDRHLSCKSRLHMTDAPPSSQGEMSEQGHGLRGRLLLNTCLIGGLFFGMAVMVAPNRTASFFGLAKKRGAALVQQQRGPQKGGLQRNNNTNEWPPPADHASARAPPSPALLIPIPASQLPDASASVGQPAPSTATHGSPTTPFDVVSLTSSHPPPASAPSAPRPIPKPLKPSSPTAPPECPRPKEPPPAAPPPNSPPPSPPPPYWQQAEEMDGLISRYGGAPMDRVYVGSPPYGGSGPVLDFYGAGDDKPSLTPKKKLQHHTPPLPPPPTPPKLTLLHTTSPHRALHTPHHTTHTTPPTPHPPPTPTPQPPTPTPPVLCVDTTASTPSTLR